MEERLWNQELFEEFCEEFTRERNRLHGEATATVATSVRDLAAIDRRLTELIRWITEEWHGVQSELKTSVKDEMTALERKKADLAATVAAAHRAQRLRPLLHPEMGKLYRDWVIEARDGLDDADRQTGATQALRAMVEEIALTPRGEELMIVLKGDLGVCAAEPIRLDFGGTWIPVGSQKDRTPVSQNLSPSSSLLPDRASACPNRWPSV
jgi:site-specific DNA recombinase